MEHRSGKRNRLGLGALLLWAAGAAACQSAASSVGGSDQALSASCVDPSAPLPADAWVCPETLRVACGDAARSATLYVRDQGAAASCEGQELSVQVDSLDVGEHEVSVQDASGGLVCEAKLVVTDEQAPVLKSKPQLYLWPPNHKFHTIQVSDCFAVEDDCQDTPKAEFIWASSDEPIDSIGDGHHAPDIQMDDCGALALRAERQGPKDGRVYKLGVRAVDAAGHASEGVCTVIVDHDQRGADGADSGEAYRVTFDGSRGLPACDGMTPPADPPPTDPPAMDPPPSEPPPSEPPVMDPPPAEPPPAEPPLS
jgi:hypothetical protein